MPAWHLGLLNRKRNRLLLIRGDIGQDATIPDDDSHEEEHSSEVSEIGDHPGG